MQKAITRASLIALTIFSSNLTFAADPELSMTIYGDNRALVEDIRSINFTPGRQMVELPGVSSQINAPSASFIADNIEIIEQNFDYDLLTPQKLMKKAVGKTVTIIRTNPGTGAEKREKAKILAVNNGVVVQIGNKVEVLRDDNLPVRVIFDGVPENLRANPTLSINVHANRPGRRKAILTYLTGGLNWRADYVVLFDENAEQMDIQGWATLTNTTQTTFKDTKVSLVAGKVGNKNRHSNRRNNRYNRNQIRSGGMEANPHERIGDNYLYPLPGKTTIASNQTKQVGFLDAKQVSAKRVYEYRNYGFIGSNEPKSADVRIAFSNSRASGLGEALPKGIVRVYTKDSKGRAQFIGEDTIGHIAGGSKLSLKIGEAFDVSVKPTLKAQERISKRKTDFTMHYELKNAKDEAVEVIISQMLWGWRSEYKILQESQKSKSISAYEKQWIVKVPAEGKADLSFKIRENRPW